MGLMGLVDTINHLWGFKGRLCYPADSETVKVLFIFNTADIDSVGNLAEHSLLRLFV
jgi:hypothetical protein